MEIYKIITDYIYTKVYIILIFINIIQNYYLTLYETILITAKSHNMRRYIALMACFSILSVTVVAQVFSEQFSIEKVRTMKELALAPYEAVPFIYLPVEPIGPRKPYVENLTAGILRETEERCNGPTSTLEPTT